MFLKKFLRCRTLCLRPRDLVSDIVLHLSDIGSIMMLILHYYCRTICPTFCPKTSDIGVKTSDMSGCPTVFQKHCKTEKKNSRPPDWLFKVSPGGQETIFYLRVASVQY